MTQIIEIHLLFAVWLYIYIYIEKRRGEKISMRFESRRLDIEVKNYLLSPVQFARFEGKVIDSIEKRESERFLFTNFSSAPPLVQVFCEPFLKAAQTLDLKRRKSAFSGFHLDFSEGGGKKGKANHL